MTKRKRKPEKSRPQERELSNKQAALLTDAVSLMRSGRWNDAARELEQLDRKVPDAPEVLLARMEVAEHLRDAGLTLELTERLARLRPRDPQLRLALAAACVRNTMPA